MTTTRRSLLLGGAAGALAACTDTPPDRPAVVDPDVALRAAAVERERRLVTSYDAVLAARPADAARLLPVRAEHVAHLVALGAPAPPAPLPAPASAARSSPAPSAGVPAMTAGPTASASRAPLPTTLAQLGAAERAAAAEHVRATVPASSALAAVLASLAASESSHPVALA